MPNEERRRIDDKWKESVETQLQLGSKQFATVIGRLDGQDVMLKDITGALAKHQARTEPVIVAVGALNDVGVINGVRALGSIGRFVAWVALKIRFWAPTVATILAIIVTVRGEWKALIEWLMFWKK